uniref:Uncharacterized protein n=1 Tax=Sphaeramia orbicularis TaxID=375764 RepID=A0A673A1A0_9TELE
MQGQHVDPEEARSVAIHWGTFALAYEVKTYKALEQKGLKSESFFTLNHGESTTNILEHNVIQL